MAAALRYERRFCPKPDFEGLLIEDWGLLIDGGPTGVLLQTARGVVVVSDPERAEMLLASGAFPRDDPFQAGLPPAPAPFRTDVDADGTIHHRYRLSDVPRSPRR